MLRVNWLLIGVLVSCAEALVTMTSAIVTISNVFFIVMRIIILFGKSTKNFWDWQIENGDL